MASFTKLLGWVWEEVLLQTGEQYLLTVFFVEEQEFSKECQFSWPVFTTCMFLGLNYTGLENDDASSVTTLMNTQLHDSNCCEPDVTS